MRSNRETACWSAVALALPLLRHGGFFTETSVMSRKDSDPFYFDEGPRSHLQRCYSHAQGPERQRCT